MQKQSREGGECGCVCVCGVGTVNWMGSVTAFFRRTSTTRRSTDQGAGGVAGGGRTGQSSLDQLQPWGRGGSEL